MEYRNYKIVSKNANSNYIIFELNDYVEFVNEKQRFVCCVNEHPFKNYQKGDEIEINLTNAKTINSYTYISRPEVLRKLENFDVYSLQQREEEEKKRQEEQLQVQEELTAHDKILIFDNFYYLLEGLEECIEKSGYYPNFRDRRQFRNLTVKETNFPLENAESLFRTRLVLFVAMHTPDFLRDEVKQKLYKWINSVGIDVNNCPERLGHFLLEINNSIEGDDKIIKQTREYLDEKYKNKIRVS